MDAKAKADRTREDDAEPEAEVEAGSSTALSRSDNTDETTSIAASPQKPNIFRRYRRRHPRVVNYASQASYRFATLIATLLAAYGLLSIVLYRFDMPEMYDYKDVTFDFPTFDTSYLKPLDENFGPYNVLLDAHSHTTFSDGRMTPPQLISWAKANGYNALVVSDHNTVAGGLAAKKWAEQNDPDFIIIPAMEYSSCRLHMNFIGIKEDFDVSPAVPTDAQLGAMMKKVKSMGGLVSVNHIPWSNATIAGYQIGTLPDHPSRELLTSMGLDAIEVINQGVFDTISWDFVRKRNLTALTGSDIHYPQNGAYGWTALNAKNRTAAGVLEELRAGRTTLLFEPSGTRRRAEIKLSNAYQFVQILDNLASITSIFYLYSAGMPSFQGPHCQPSFVILQPTVIFSTLFYLLVGFLMYEIARATVLFLWRRLLARLRSGRHNRSII